MSPEFYHQIFNTQQKTEVVPPNEQIANWALNLIRLLYPERSETIFMSPAEIGQAFKQLQKELTGLLNATRACCDDDNTEKAQTFFEMIPELYRVLNTDIDAIVLGDPAAHTRFEVIRAYPGFLPSAFTGLHMPCSTWKHRCCRASLQNMRTRKRVSTFIPPQRSGSISLLIMARE